jgi:hypothetical protein
MQILFYIFIAFIGYSIGRITHIYLGYIESPHHWIYGLILIILGLIFYKHFLGLLALSLGAGHFISDFDDFLHLKFYGEEEDGEKKFWGIN